MMSNRFRYLTSDEAIVGNMPLRRVPVTLEENAEPVGELDGLLIDVVDRRVEYLIVEAARTGRKHVVPLDGTSLDPEEKVLERVSAEPIESCELFDASKYARYDDDALMSLLFGRRAA